MVNQMANMLRSHGVQRGDRVVIYMSVAPQAVAAMLACARIGAPHSIVFAGFSAEALATRIQDGKYDCAISNILLNIFMPAEYVAYRHSWSEFLNCKPSNSVCQDPKHITVLVFWDHTAVENSLCHLSRQLNSFLMSSFQLLNYDVRRPAAFAAFHFVECFADQSCRHTGSRSLGASNWRDSSSSSLLGHSNSALNNLAEWSTHAFILWW